MKRMRMMGTWLLAAVLVIALSGVAQADDASVDEFEGTIDSLTENSVVIDGQTISITGDTEIEGTVAVGTTVEVEIFVQPDGLLMALEIEIDDDDRDDDDWDDDDDRDDDDDWDWLAFINWSTCQVGITGIFISGGGVRQPLALCGRT